MKYKRWAALGLALFGFSLLGNPTTAVAASKLSSLRTEVSQLKTQRDTLTAAIADLEASATSKAEAKDTAAATLAEGEAAHKDLESKNAEIEEANGQLLDQIEESQNKEESLRKDLDQVDSSKGDELAAYIEANYQELGVYYVIWEQRYLMDQGSIYGPAWTWNMMPDRGSAYSCSR